MVVAIDRLVKIDLILNSWVVVLVFLKVEIFWLFHLLRLNGVFKEAFVDKVDFYMLTFAFDCIFVFFIQYDLAIS